MTTENSEAEVSATAEVTEVELDESGQPIAEASVEAETPEVRLDKMEKRLHDSQAKITEMGQENAELRGKVDVLDRPAPVESEAISDPYDDLNEDEVLENPMLIVEASRAQNDRLIHDVGGALRLLKDDLLNELKQQNPERLALKTDIDELRSEPELAGLSDDALMAIAKRSRRVAPARKVEAVKPAGVPAGGSRVSATASDDEVRESPLYKMMYAELQEEGE